MSEDAGEMLDRLGTDAALWAKEFRETAIRLGYSDMDEGWLIGWFANAIERCDCVRCNPLRAELAAAKKTNEVQHVFAMEQVDRAYELRGKVAKLREALERIELLWFNDDSGTQNAREACAMARAALAETGGERK